MRQDLTSVELSPQFPALDTLRAVGALAVLTTHTMFWSGDYLGNAWLGTLWARLDVGVALFFVLSGFLLSRPWVARHALGMSPPDTRRYLRKRFWRIYPAYAVVAVISLALLHDNRGASPLDWLATLTLTDIYVHPSLPAGLSQMWSLATEVLFYALLPLLMPLLLRRGAAAAVGGLTILSALSVWWVLEGAWQPVLLENAMPLQWLPSFVLWFAGGMLLALLHVGGQRPAGNRLAVRAHGLATGLGAAPGACLVAAAGLLLVSATPLAGPALLAAPTPAQLLTKVVLYTAIALLLVVPAVFTTGGSAYTSIMALRLPRHLGHVSYSLFCVHLPVLHFVMWWRDLTLFAGNGWQIWSLTLALSLIAAEALYWLVERPALRRLGRPRPATTTKAPTAASTTA